eukprot:3306767-Pleurochrysis_carterae.AAC.1
MRVLRKRIIEAAKVEEHCKRAAYEHATYNVCWMVVIFSYSACRHPNGQEHRGKACNKEEAGQTDRQLPASQRKAIIARCNPSSADQLQ